MRPMSRNAPLTALTSWTTETCDMAETEFLVIFSYDIERDANRRRIARMLEEHGTRVQLSVFETRMKLAKAKRLLKRLDRERVAIQSGCMYLPNKAVSALSHWGAHPSAKEASSGCCDLARPAKSRCPGRNSRATAGASARGYA